MNFKTKIESIKSSVSMVQFLNDHGFSVQDGVETQIQCFAHDDVHPSARVYPQSNTVYCWTCTRAFDVIAAAMIIKELAIKDAVDYLINKYNVLIKAGKGVVEDFYRKAIYQKIGDPRRAQTRVIKLGDEFRFYYQSVVGWKHIPHIIDWLWDEFDLIFALPATPKERFNAAIIWYNDAISLVQSYKPHCLYMEQLSERVKQAGLK